MTTAAMSKHAKVIRIVTDGTEPVLQLAASDVRGEAGQAQLDGDQ